MITSIDYRSKIYLLLSTYLSFEATSLNMIFVLLLTSSPGSEEELIEVITMNHSLSGREFLSLLHLVFQFYHKNMFVVFLDTLSMTPNLMPFCYNYSINFIHDEWKNYYGCNLRQMRHRVIKCTNMLFTARVHYTIPHNHPYISWCKAGLL